MKLNLAFLGFNILLCTILLGDAFMLPANLKSVTTTQFESKLTRGKRGYYHYNYFIFTSDGCKYEVKERLYEELTVNDTIKIFSSPIINMPIKLQYTRNGSPILWKIGELHTQESEKVGLIISLIMSVILFVLQCIMPFQRSSIYFGIEIIAFATSLTVFLFIIIEVLSI